MIDVIYEDNHLLVVNKPAGILTQPSGTDQPSLEALAKAYIKEKYQKPGNVFLEAVHRIDKPVSGIVVFAKTSKALSRLNESMRSKNVRKIYWARLDSQPNPPAATLEHHLIHDDYRAQVSPLGKLARLHYRTLPTGIVEIELETGRYHQIRVQMAEIGCPIMGDAKYGSVKKCGRDGIALHHRLLELKHPTTGEMLFLEAPASNLEYGG
jgi:23S rRNA pseudouridine1911/1915/1917 synthase